jgi:hypothetical protein
MARTLLFALKEGNAMSLRFLLILPGGLEILAGLPAWVSPAPVVLLLLGSPLDSIGAVLARRFGAGLFWLGVPAGAFPLTSHHRSFRISHNVSWELLAGC